MLNRICVICEWKPQIKTLPNSQNTLTVFKAQPVLAPQLQSKCCKRINKKEELCKQQINASIPAASVRDRQRATIAVTHAPTLRKVEWTTNATADIRTAVNRNKGEHELHLKSVGAQTIVITGATSSIGLVTARMAAKRDAKLVLVARNEDALQELAEEINAVGGVATYAVADVADEAAVKTCGADCKRSFRRFRHVG